VSFCEELAQMFTAHWGCGQQCSGGRPARKKEKEKGNGGRGDGVLILGPGARGKLSINIDEHHHEQNALCLSRKETRSLVSEQSDAQCSELPS